LPGVPNGTRLPSSSITRPSQCGIIVPTVSVRVSMSASSDVMVLIGLVSVIP
jgi:hypothetical protein